MFNKSEFPNYPWANKDTILDLMEHIRRFLVKKICMCYIIDTRTNRLLNSSCRSTMTRYAQAMAMSFVDNGYNFIIMK